MALGATGSDLTAWPDLLKSAQGGNLKLVKVDSAALKVLTDACENLVADILGLIKALEGLQWPPILLDWSTLDKTVTLNSMSRLFKKYHDKLSIEMVRVGTLVFVT